MYSKLLADGRFYHVLERIDADLATQVRAGGCRACDGRLDSARYPRKPRGALVALGDDYARRFSFCCAQDGCRLRTTPPSVRFLGRKVYLGAVVVVVTTMRHGTTPSRLSKLRDRFGVSRETVERWRVFWQETFVASRCFQAARGCFDSPVDTTRLPLSLLERFRGDALSQVVSLLRFLLPLTTTSAGRLELTLTYGRS